MLFRSIVLIQFLVLFLSCFCLGVLASCGSSSESEFQLTGSFPLCHAMDSIGLYAVDGFSLKPLISVPLFKSKDEARFVMRGHVPVKGIYLLGNAPDNLMSIVIGAEQGMHISGDCEDVRQLGKISGSPANADFAELNVKLAQLGQSDSAVREKQTLIDSLIPVNPFLAKRVALELIDPFDLENNAVDLQDSTYGYMPLLSEYIHIYTQGICRAAPTQEDAEQSLDQFLNQMVDGSLAHKNSLAAVLQTLDLLQNPSFLTYAQRYQDLYGLMDQQTKNYLTRRIQYYQGRVEVESQLSVGSIAPEIELPTPSGERVSVSDFRGKIVLLAFGASWSEASRTAHPRMKRLYQRYKTRGFEILEISLDHAEEAWIQSIIEDQCDWYHLSDLKFWESVAAKIYHVESIPTTFLLDRNGKIIGKNLHGSTLEVKLAELFEN